MLIAVSSRLFFPIMITYSEANFTQLSIHKVGNITADEPLNLSEQPVLVADETLGSLLMQYFLSPFEKTNEIFHLAHSSGNLDLNEVYHFAQDTFNNKDTFHINSQHIAKHLYKISSHPKIKSGELYVVYFTSLQQEGELYDAIGIFKSESKEPFITIQQEANAFNIGYETAAINVKKLDKGCIIFNTDEEAGYKVAVTDQTNRTDAMYWIDDFLQLKVRNDNYNQTQTTLSVYKNFVTEKMEEAFDISKADKIDLLNRSIKYFKEKDSFDMDEFANEVIANEQGIELFKEFKNNYAQEFDTALPDSFAISDAAVKKQARVFKSVLKLDKNFHIYIHGNKDLIEKGFDEGMQMNYYKVYFREEK